MARLGSASLSGFGSVTSMVRGSITLNWSAEVIDPVSSCALPSTGAVTTRSSDHLTSSAVTGEPSWNFASLRRRNVIFSPSGLTS